MKPKLMIRMAPPNNIPMTGMPYFVEKLMLVWTDTYDFHDAGDWQVDCDVLQLPREIKVSRL